MTAHARKTAVILGAGPGLGLSMARRFGREGYVPALVSRSSARHAGYLASLAEAGIDADSLAADVRDQAQVRSALDAIADRHGAIEVLYYGPAAVDPSADGCRSAWCTLTNVKWSVIQSVCWMVATRQRCA